MSTLKSCFAAYSITPNNPRWSTIARNAEQAAAAIWDDELEFTEGMLVHESRLADWQTSDSHGNVEWKTLLPELLRDNVPIRLIIAARKLDSAGVRDFYTKPEVIGRVTFWDTDRLRIEFKRNPK